MDLTLTNTPLTQPNLIVPPLASFAAKAAAASSAAEGSSPLARPSSNGSCQPITVKMRKSERHKDGKVSKTESYSEVKQQVDDSICC